MPDRLDHFLESLIARSPAPPPPGGFLAAVARRRFQRRMVRASVGAVCLAIGAMAAVFVARQPAARSTPDTVTAAPATRESILALVHANASFDTEHLRLPDTPAVLSAPAPRLGMRLDPGQIEHWTGR